MNKNKDILTLKELYQSLSDGQKVIIRDFFLTAFQYSYPAFYQKLREDRFKIVEREFLMQEIEKATNTDIN